MQRRVEVCCPILNADLKNRVYRMLETMLTDNVQAWELFSDGQYIKRDQLQSNLAVNSQEFFTQEAKNNALNAAGLIKPQKRVHQFIKRISKVFYPHGGSVI